MCFIDPIVEIIECVDRSGRESGEEKQVIHIRQHVYTADVLPITLHKPVNHTEENVRQAKFFDREEMFLHESIPPLAEPRLHKRIVSNGEHGNKQTEHYCQQPLEFAFPQYYSCTVYMMSDTINNMNTDLGDTILVRIRALPSRIRILFNKLFLNMNLHAEKISTNRSMSKNSV